MIHETAFKMIVTGATMCHVWKVLIQSVLQKRELGARTKSNMYSLRNEKQKHIVTVVTFMFLIFFILFKVTKRIRAE